MAAAIVGPTFHLLLQDANGGPSNSDTAFAALTFTAGSSDISGTYSGSSGVLLTGGAAENLSGGTGTGSYSFPTLTSDTFTWNTSGGAYSVAADSASTPVADFAVGVSPTSSANEQDPSILVFVQAPASAPTITNTVWNAVGIQLNTSTGNTISSFTVDRTQITVSNTGSFTSTTSVNPNGAGAPTTPTAGPSGSSWTVASDGSFAANSNGGPYTLGGAFSASGNVLIGVDNYAGNNTPYLHFAVRQAAAGSAPTSLSGTYNAIQYAPSGPNGAGLTAYFVQVVFQSTRTWSVTGTANFKGTAIAVTGSGTYTIDSSGAFTLTTSGSGGNSWTGAISPDGNTAVLADLNNDGAANNNGIIVAVHE